MRSAGSQQQPRRFTKNFRCVLSFRGFLSCGSLLSPLGSQSPLRHKEEEEGREGGSEEGGEGGKKERRAKKTTQGKYIITGPPLEPIEKRAYPQEGQQRRGGLFIVGQRPGRGNPGLLPFTGFLTLFHNSFLRGAQASHLTKTGSFGRLHVPRGAGSIG